MQFLNEQFDLALQLIGEGSGFQKQNILHKILDLLSSKLWQESSLLADDILQYSAATLGISSAALIALLCVKYFSPTPKQAAIHNESPILDEKTLTGGESDFAVEKHAPQICVKPKIKKRNILNVKGHELRNFENESELEKFYCWRQSLPQATEEEYSSDSDSSNDVCEAVIDETFDSYEFQAHVPVSYNFVENTYQQMYMDRSYENHEDESGETFDKFYRAHTYLPPFVQDPTAIEKYTETKLASLEADKQSLGIQYTAENLTYGLIMKLYRQELVPIDVSPDVVTDIIANGRRIPYEDVVETLCKIYDLCIKTKVAEWALQFRKSVQPYFRNRHYRKQFQTRPINDLLQDIQNYYNVPA